MSTGKAIELHKRFKGKISVSSKIKVNGNIPYLYTPGVAAVAKEIQREKKLAYDYTFKSNSVAIVSDCSRVLGLGDIGPLAGLPVMEGKALLFKVLADIDAFPICLRTKKTDEIIKTVINISPSFGGINLEDIASPKCFEIEERLKEELEKGETPVPVCHDDQHGTAVIVSAALKNALRVVKKKLGWVSIVFVGCGAAGYSCFKLLRDFGMDPGRALVFNKKGIIYEGKPNLLPHEQEIAKITNRQKQDIPLSEAFSGKDVVIALSTPGPRIITPQMVERMNEKAIVFTLANPVSEISYKEAKEAGAAVVATGSSIEPNQVNDVLCMPAIFRGALDIGASGITNEMLKAASDIIAKSIPENSLNEFNIIPKIGKTTMVARIAAAVAQEASDSKKIDVRNPIYFDEEFKAVKARLKPVR